MFHVLCDESEIILKYIYIKTSRKLYFHTSKKYLLFKITKINTTYTCLVKVKKKKGAHELNLGKIEYKTKPMFNIFQLKKLNKCER